MNISNNNTFCSFKAKSPEVRLADDIMRKSKQNFPCFSTTFARNSYQCCKIQSNYYDKAVDLINKIGEKIFINLRGGDTNTSVRGAEVLDRLKTYKLGNCYEKAMAAVAQLKNRGFKCLPVYLGLESFCWNSKTGERTNEKNFNLDHVLVVTAMNNKERAEKYNLIVVDPWLNFTAEKNEAIEKYIKFFYVKIAENIIKYKQIVNEAPSGTKIRHKIEFFSPPINEKYLEEIYQYLK